MDQGRVPAGTSQNRGRPVPHRRRTALAVALVIVAAMGVGLALLIPAIQEAREAARRNWRISQFAMISLALLNYESANGEFPPAYTTDAEGKPLHSWRTLILPYMEERALFNTIDLTKPWDDPVNARALAAMPDVYRCHAREKNDNLTTYLAVVTSKSFIQPTAPRNKAKFKGGTSNAIMMIEVDHAHAVPWMAPSDADEIFIRKLAQRALEPPHASGFTVGYADGHSAVLDADTLAEALRRLISVARGD